MAKGARAGLAGETLARAAERAVHRRLTRKAASAKVAPGESVRTAGVAATMEAWRATHSEATTVRRRRMKAAARVESTSAHAHAATTHVEAATTHVEAAAATHVEAATSTAVEAATAAAVESTSTAAVSAPTAATPGGRRIGREGGNHGHAR
jgi:hypothetical protein